MLLGYTSCTDDHFDIRTDVPSATSTLWQNIEANEQLSDLEAILKRVKVYTMGEFSKEICGGPHVESTGKLGTFKIQKEQSCGSGIRRIKAVLL